MQPFLPPMHSKLCKDHHSLCKDQITVLDRTFTMHKTNLHEQQLTSSADEASIVERARSDPEAFGILYDMTYDRILNFIYRRTLNVVIAEELTSNTYFKALRAIKCYKHNAPFITWLYRIALNEIRMHYRSRKNGVASNGKSSWDDDIERIHFPADTEDQSSDDIRSRMHDYIEVNKLLEKLPEKYRNVIVLKYIEQLTHEEISGVLGTRVGTVKSLVNRGLVKLREYTNADNKTDLFNS